MPATAGRVRMPANNRVHSSAALQTHGIWQSAIGYDPYAPNKEENKGTQQAASSSAPEAENAYASFQGLLALARVTNSNADEARGSCKKCGRVGHLTYQCRNFLSIKDENEKDPEAIEAAALSELDKLKRIWGKKNGGESEEESSEEESESSDSDYDSELERAIAKKFGNKANIILKSSKKKKKEDSDEDRKKRGRSKKRRNIKKIDSESDTEDDRRRRKRKEKRRRKEESSEEEEKGDRRRESMREKRRRRSHRRSEGSDSSEESDGRRKRRSRMEDSRVGRSEKKRSEKESRKDRYEREN